MSEISPRGDTVDPSDKSDKPRVLQPALLLPNSQPTARDRPRTRPPARDQPSTATSSKHYRSEDQRVEDEAAEGRSKTKESERRFFVEEEKARSKASKISQELTKEAWERKMESAQAEGPPTSDDDDAHKFTAKRATDDEKKR